MEVIVDETEGKHITVFVEAISLCNGLLNFLCFVLEIRVTLVRCSVNARKSLLHRQANLLKIWSFAFIEQQ